MAEQKTDLGAALTGLIVGSIALFILVFGVVKLTSASFQNHSTTAPAAATH